MPSLMPNGKQQFFTAAGVPLSGGKIYTYSAGTVTPKVTYSDAAGTVPNTNPIVLDSRGEAIVFWSGSYKVSLQDSTGASIYTVDNYVTDPVSTSLALFAATTGAALVGYIDTSPGSTATTVQAKLRTMPDHASGGFWPDSVPIGNIQRQYDRIFLGGATVADGTLANTVKDWLETERAYTTRNSQFACTSTIGQSAVLGGSRTSDSLNSGSQGCIGITGIAINDNATQLQSVYGAYFEARRKTGAGVTHGIEVDVVNQGSGVVVQPYSPAPQGMTNGAWIASGGGVAGAVASSIGIGIINNGATFDKGILFQNNSITGTDGTTGTGTAIGFAKGHALTWYNPSGAPASTIYSNSSGSTIGAGILLTDGAAQFINTANSSIKFQATYSATNVNFVGVAASDTGTGPAIQALGTDANIDIRLAPQGTGVFAVTYGSSTVTSPSAFSATRKLAFKDGNNITWYIPISTVAW